METDKPAFYDGRESVYKQFLHNLSKKLSRKNIEDLKFFSDIPGNYKLLNLICALHANCQASELSEFQENLMSTYK